MLIATLALAAMLQAVQAAEPTRECSGAALGATGIPGYRSPIDRGPIDPCQNPQRLEPPQPSATSLASEGTGPIGMAVWVRAPRTEIPERAVDRGIKTGQVVLFCNQSPEGVLSGCVIESENPAGLGFGQNAIRSIRHARTQGGEPRVRFTVQF